MTTNIVFLASIILTWTSCLLVQADLIDTVCAKAKNPTSCKQSLRSDPGSSGTDLAGLGQIAINKSGAATQAAIPVAKSVQTKGNVAIIKTCIENFGDAISGLNKCTGYLKSRDVPSLRSYASSALTSVDTCNDEFGGTEPAPLKQATTYAEEWISVLLAVGALLA